MQALIVELIALVATAVGHPELSPAGDYLCTVGQKAGIAGIHLEGAGPPSAFAKVGPATKFKMRITLEPKRPKHYHLIEIAYDGPDRDGAEWEDEHSVLHSRYVGDGSHFHAVDGPGFFDMAAGADQDGNQEFYHAGFEHPGGEDTNLSVRWGQCRKTK
jgi:hypothetical protein